MTDTHFKDTAYYRNLDPLIKYGDTWLYGAALPTANVGVPNGVFVIHEKDYNIISWKTSVSSDIVGYRIYRSTTIGHADAKELAIVLDTDSNGNVLTCYVDYLLDSELGTQFYYAVASINTSDYTSFLSDWAADITIDNSFVSKKYLYTDQLTQSYWSIIDLYKRLGNIDTDRNIIPFRDRGNTYVQTYTDSGFQNMYLRGEISVEDGYLNNKGNAEVGYLTEGSDSTRLIPKNVPVKIDCNYLYCTTLPTDELKEYTFYMDDAPIATNKSSTTVSATIYESDELNNLSNLVVDKTTFSSKVEGSGTYNFYWNDVYNYWQDETTEVDLAEFGITYTGTPVSHNVISVDFSIIGYVYFRIPYIYNSKVLQTYIKSSDDIIYNKLTFKAYNHLIFASTLGKIFNGIQIDLRETKGNLYTTEVSDPFVYKNFASYFNFEQPAWLDNVNYRNCVLGNTKTGESGLWQAGMHGGTQLGLTEAVTALAAGNFTISSLADVDYLTIYSDYKTFNADTIKPYTENTTYALNDVVLYNDNYYQFTSSVQQLATSTAYVSGDLVWYDGNYYCCLLDHTSPQGITTAYLNWYWTTDIFSSAYNTSLVCVNNDYKDVLFVTEYDSTNPLTVQTLTETGDVTCNVYDIINIDSHFYEVREVFNYFYNLLICSDTAPNVYGVENGTFYYNTSLNKLYVVEAGVWVESSTDLKTGAVYLDQTSGLLYQYDGETLVEQTYLRLVDQICNILKVSAPIDLQAVYSLNGTEYYLKFLEIPEDRQDYLFYDIDDASDDNPVSYTHSYIINTYQVEFDNWKRNTNPEKYLVYGNKVQLNNKNIIYPSSNFVVSYDEAQASELPVAAYTLNPKTGILTWADPTLKPEDGSYIYVKYTVDIRPDIKKLMELFKFPQVNIRYVWE